MYTLSFSKQTPRCCSSDWPSDCRNASPRAISSWLRTNQAPYWLLLLLYSFENIPTKSSSRSFRPDRSHFRYVNSSRTCVSDISCCQSLSQTTVFKIANSSLSIQARAESGKNGSKSVVPFSPGQRDFCACRAISSVRQSFCRFVAECTG